MNLVTLLSKHKWNKKKEKSSIVYSTGSFYVNDNIYSDEECSSYILDLYNRNKNINKLLNGFYSFIIETDIDIIISCDHVRSMGLYYSLDIKNNNIIVSDNAENLRNHLNYTKMDPSAEKELLLTGYVTGCSTLFPGIKQVQAGEIVKISKKNMTIISEQHYNFISKEPNNFDQIDLFKKHTKILHSSFTRLVDFAKGSQIVVPLSAGHDSLLILSFLKSINYKNVITFTYGLKNNNEAKISKKRADSLGYKWIFIEYDDKIWKDEWETDMANEYQLYSGNCSTLPHIQDYIAVKRLKDNRYICDNAIFTPGHCVTGATIPKFIFSSKALTLKNLSEFLYNKHYINNRKLSHSCTVEFTNKISLYLNKFKHTENHTSYANLIEHWGWKERESKYIVNSLQIYYFFGYRAWMPLWDREYAQFWGEMPLVLRVDRCWYNNYIDMLYLKVINNEKLNPTIFKLPNLSVSITKKIKNSNNFFIRLLKNLNNGKNILWHPLCFNKNTSVIKNIINILLGNHILYEYSKKYLNLYKKNR